MSITNMSKGSKSKMNEKQFKNMIFEKKLWWLNIWLIYVAVSYQLNYIENWFFRKIDKIPVPI